MVNVYARNDGKYAVKLEQNGDRVSLILVDPQTEEEAYEILSIGSNGLEVFDGLDLDDKMIPFDLEPSSTGIGYIRLASHPTI